MSEEKVKKIKKRKVIVPEPNKENVKSALIKKALGYEVIESVEEYTFVENKLELTKKKVSSKYYPPDLSAIELALNLFGVNDNQYSNYSDDELLQEKDELLKLFKKIKGEKND